MNDFDHVIIPHLPGWVREPPDDYQDDEDEDPDYEDVSDKTGQPMLVIINGEIHSWHDELETFCPSGFRLDDNGKVVAS